jgi:hypothetical protein
VAIGNQLVLEESNRLGNQIVAGVAGNFDPGKFSNGRFAPPAKPSFKVQCRPYAGDKDC